MAKYLTRVSLNAEGVRLLRQDKASGRRAAVTKFIEAAGGKVEAFYFAFGQDDLFIISDVPDNVAAAALSLVTNSIGMVRASITPLISVEGNEVSLGKGCALQLVFLKLKKACSESADVWLSKQWFAVQRYGVDGSPTAPIRLPEQR